MPKETRLFGSTTATTTSCREAIRDAEQAAGRPAPELEDIHLCPVASGKPLITKLDSSLSTLKACRALRLSSNAIQTLEGLEGCVSLKTLSVGRNLIKRIQGLDCVASHLEQLWVSYNELTTLAGVEKLVQLKARRGPAQPCCVWGGRGGASVLWATPRVVPCGSYGTVPHTSRRTCVLRPPARAHTQVLYASNNRLEKWSDVDRLKALPLLRDLLLVNNPIYKRHNCPPTPAEPVGCQDWREQVLGRLRTLKTLDGLQHVVVNLEAEGEEEDDEAVAVRADVVVEAGEEGM